MQRMTTTLTREELYALVWSEPIQKIALRYGLSDRGFGKLCARYEIPVPVLRKFIGERILVGSRGVAGQAILMVQPSQNRRREHLGVFGEAMTSGHDLVPFGQGLGEPGSEAGMWTTAVIVADPFAKDRSEMCLVDRDSQSRHSRRSVPISRSQNALACGVRTGVLSTCRPIDTAARSTVVA